MSYRNIYVFEKNIVLFVSFWEGKKNILSIFIIVWNSIKSNLLDRTEKKIRTEWINKGWPIFFFFFFLIFAVDDQNVNPE